MLCFRNMLEHFCPNTLVLVSSPLKHGMTLGIFLFTEKSFVGSTLTLFLFFVFFVCGGHQVVEKKDILNEGFRLITK